MQTLSWRDREQFCQCFERYPEQPYLHHSREKHYAIAFFSTWPPCVIYQEYHCLDYVVWPKTKCMKSFQCDGTWSNICRRAVPPSNQTWEAPAMIHGHAIHLYLLKRQIVFNSQAHFRNREDLHPAAHGVLVHGNINELAVTN